MKKICIVTTVSLTMEAFVIETAKHLHQNEGYDITLICDTDQNFADSLPEYLHYIPVKMARGIDFSALGSIRRLYKIFKTQKFDLVQYATPNAACYASIAAFFARVPLRLYSQWGIRYIGLHGISRKIFKLVEKMVCRLSTHIRAVSHKNMQFAISEKLYKQDKAAVIGNGGTIGVDTSEYDVTKKDTWCKATRDKYNIPGDAFVFGFAGRISIDKGCRELLAAFQSTLKDHPNAHLMVIGPKEADPKSDIPLMKWAENNENITFTDSVPKNEMKFHYSALNVLVHPTYREGFGMVIQEAGALAVPTITTDIPGASEVMENGSSCMLVSARNTEQLTSAMKHLIKNPEQAEAYGTAAYERTKALYDRPVMLYNQLQEYKKILGETSK